MFVSHCPILLQELQRGRCESPIRHFVGFDVLENERRTLFEVFERKLHCHDPKVLHLLLVERPVGEFGAGAGLGRWRGLAARAEVVEEHGGPNARRDPERLVEARVPVPVRFPQQAIELCGVHGGNALARHRLCLPKVQAGDHACKRRPEVCDARAAADSGLLPSAM